MTLYSLLSEGYGYDYEPSGPLDRETRLKSGIIVRVHDIPSILRDEEALDALRFYKRFKRMGMPFDWGDCPNRMVLIVDLLAPLDESYHPGLSI